MSVERPLWRRWLLPACLVLLAAHLVILVAWTVPRGLRQHTAEARAEKARVELDGQRRELAQLRERAQAIRANASDTRRLLALCAGTEQTEQVPVHEAVQSMARSVGLRPGSRGVRLAEVDETPLQQMAITLPLSGSYDQLVGFLREVERSPRFLTVDGVSMQADQGSARLQVELSTYVKAPASEAAERRTRAR